GREPFVHMFLNELDRYFSGLDHSAQTGVPGKQVVELFLQHRLHAGGERLESGVTQHGELVLAVTIDQLCIAIEIKPILNILIEGAKQPAVIEGASLEQLLCFKLSR